MSGVDIESYRSTNIPVTTSPNPAPLTQVEVGKSSFINNAQKWAKRKEQTNTNRRLLHKQNPERYKYSSRINYYKHASSVKKHVLDAYYSKHDF